MAGIKADTRVRLCPAELKGLSFEGGPASVTVADEATGAEVEVPASDGGFSIPCAAAPRLLTATWELDGVRATAQLDVVASQYCTIEEIKAYRADQYQLESLHPDDSAFFEARARAAEDIERECRRVLQPVMRTGFIDRPACTYRTMVMGEGGYQSDLISVVRCFDGDGEVDARQVRPGSDYVDVSRMRIGQAAEVVYTCGMRQTPPGMRDAVVALAALYLAPKTAPDNATSTSTEAGVLSFVVGGVNGATSIPEVNALISRYGHAGLVVG